MAATQYAADTPLLAAGLVATGGIFALWRLWIYGIAFLLLGFLLGQAWWRAGVITDAELCELRYDGRSATLLRGVKAVYYGLVFNCAVLAMVQPNRAGSKAEGIPTMHDIRGSSAVENAADTVISMVRADPFAPGFSYPLVLSVQKARNGRPGGLGGEYELGAGTFMVGQLKSEREAMV